MDRPAGPAADIPPPRKPHEINAETAARRIAWGCVVWVAVAVLVACVTASCPPRPGKQKQFACQHNLSQLAAIYVECRVSETLPPRSGQALLLAWRKSGTKIRRGQEGVLVCPGDQAVSPPDTPAAVARYDDVDLDDPPDDLCSYVVRDFDRFPPDPDRLADEPFAACGGFHGGGWNACHRGGINVAFCDGSTRFLEWSELGLGTAVPPDTPLVLGPSSPSPVLRVLCLRPSGR